MRDGIGVGDRAWLGLEFGRALPIAAQPRADDVPFFAFSTHNVPSTANPLGVKGAGEAGAVAAPPAVINAIVDALHHRVGLRHIDMEGRRFKSSALKQDRVNRFGFPPLSEHALGEINLFSPDVG
jgi:hypothetical protein